MALSFWTPSKQRSLLPSSASVQHWCGRRHVLQRSLAAAMVGMALPLRAMDAPRRARALLMVAGDYGGDAWNLPGSEQDLGRAVDMARWMGAGANVQVLQDRALTLAAVDSALAALATQTQPDETVLVYYSGHGRQVDGSRFGSRCSEGLVLPQGHLYLDQAVVHHLHRIAARAAQVLMLSDACHAGGLASKQMLTAEVPSRPQMVAKVYRGALHAAADVPAGQCGHVTNKQAPMLLDAQRPARWLHVAAAARDQAAWATPHGSQATQAWHLVFSQARARGLLTGSELQAQAQSWLDARAYRQQVALTGSDGISWALFE